MNFSRTVVLGSALLLLSACGSNGGRDAGSNLVTCTDGITSLSVTVRDDTGAPVKGATVSSQHVGTGTTVTSTTNDQGIATAVTSDQGSGSIRITATAGARVAQMQQVEWTCGECTCTAVPASVVLTVQ